MKITLFVIACFMQCIVMENSCSGGFDVYFVLDKSTSVSLFNFQNKTVQFVENILEHLVSPKLRASVVTFSTNAKLEIPLTRNRLEIKKGINDLKRVVPNGDTYLEYGIDEVISQIKTKGVKTASVVILLTDGELTDVRSAVNRANKLRELGAAVFAVGVDQYRESQLIRLANKPSSDFVFTATNYQTLQLMTDKIINKACVEVTSIEPSEVCVRTEYTVRLRGNGFTRTYDKAKIICKFIVNKTYEFVTKPSAISDTGLTCKGPVITKIGMYVLLQLSVNGKTFISSDKKVTAISCVKQPQSNPAGAIGAVLLSLFLLALMAIWWFWRLLPCVKSKQSKKATLLPVTEPESPTKKWPTLDASFYGGGGVGGVKPVRVKWGDKGATEAGNKLTKTPDAKIISPGDEGNPQNSTSGSSQTSCFGRSKIAVISLFTGLYPNVSAVRPQKGGKSRLYSASDER